MEYRKNRCIEYQKSSVIRLKDSCQWRSFSMEYVIEWFKIRNPNQLKKIVIQYFSQLFTLNIPVTLLRNIHSILNFPHV